MRPAGLRVGENNPWDAILFEKQGGGRHSGFDGCLSLFVKGDEGSDG